MDPAPPPDAPAADDGGEVLGRELLVPARRPPVLPAAVLGSIDVGLGVAVVVATPVLRVSGALLGWLRPPVASLLRAGADPPFLPERARPVAVAGRLQQRGQLVRQGARYDAAAVSAVVADVVVPATIDLVLDRVDLTGLVLDRVELGRVVSGALDEMDLTEVVIDRVALATVVQAALADLDLTDLVRTQVDLAALADEVIDAVDLPEIIQESTTGVASDVVQGARLGAIGADERISRLVDKVLLRRHARTTEAPSGEEGR